MKRSAVFLGTCIAGDLNRTLVSSFFSWSLFVVDGIIPSESSLNKLESLFVFSSIFTIGIGRGAPEFVILVELGVEELLGLFNGILTSSMFNIDFGFFLGGAIRGNEFALLSEGIKVESLLMTSVTFCLISESSAASFNVRLDPIFKESFSSIFLALVVEVSSDSLII